MEKEIKKISTKKIPKNVRQIIRFFGKLAGLLLVLYLVLFVVFGVFNVSGESMFPSVKDGDTVVFYRLDKIFEVGDVIVFERYKNSCVARIVAKEGDEISLSEDGRLKVNGHIRDEEVFFETKALADGIEYPYKVPKDSYFLLCDYRTQCVDSRGYGAISENDIKGKVISVLRKRGF